MRGALSEALYWTRNRSAFQRRLIDQPMMRAVLADLTLDLEGTAALASASPAPSMATATKTAPSPASRWRWPGSSATSRPDLRGDGMPGRRRLHRHAVAGMLYREAPLNSIWEGSGNVICLDVLARAFPRSRRPRRSGGRTDRRQAPAPRL
ncbi:MAG: acyl-CoA dehydrogenase family protein [Paracoccaceae bacterium]